MFVFSVFCFIIILYYLYFRRSRNALYEFYRSMPHVGHLPLIGHMHWFIGGSEKILQNVAKLLELVFDAGGLSTLWLGSHLYLVASNHDDVQKILETCLQKNMPYKFLQKWLGNGLFVADVDIWKQHRRLLLPIFHNKIVDDYMSVFNEQSDILVKRLDENCGKSEFDVYPYITACTLDIVFETAMGERMDVQRNPDTPYLRARHSVMSIINMRIFKVWLQPDLLFNLTPYAKIQKENIDLTHQFTDEVVNKKRTLFNQNGSSTYGRKNMLELLMERNNSFSNKQLREHIDSITIAGNDTTALVIAYTLVVLGQHLDIQEKVYKELKDIFGELTRTPTNEDVNKISYMERVLKETMRLYCVVPIIGRKTQKELKLSTCTVPAGVSCVVVPFVMHRSKAIWGSDADVFNPDRFLSENSANRHPCAFLAFSYGSRNCIGRHFAMLAMKTILSKILLRYKITASSDTLDRLKMEVILYPVKGHLLALERRAG